MLNFGAVNGPFTKRLIDWASSGAPSIQMDMSWVDRAFDNKWTCQGLIMRKQYGYTFS